MKFISPNVPRVPRNKNTLHCLTCMYYVLSAGPHGGRAFAVVGPSTWNSLSKRFYSTLSTALLFLAVCSKHSSFHTNVCSTLETLARMRYIIPRLTLHYA